MRLVGKKALVTGGARGIGRGCALALAREGADISVNDREMTDDVEQLIQEIRALGRQAEFLPGNIFDRATCGQIVDEAVQRMGQVDILVSNPAFSRRGEFLEYSAELFEKTIEGTLTAGFHISQYVSKHMVARGGPGKIVFISSLHARVPFVNSVAYNAAKRGIIAMAETIAAELIPWRINVNVIEPGWIDTPGERAAFGDSAVDSGGTALPWGRLGQPDDIGRAAAFLCSNDADYITGTSLLVDGGLWLKAAIPVATPVVANR